MTDVRLTRLYVFAVTLLVFFVVWAVVAARPWVTRSSSSSSRQIAALAARERRIHFESLLVRKLKAQRVKQQQVAAPAPAPRIVTLPPLVITRTS